MKEALREKHRLAFEYDGGVPAITVVIDGGLHCHSYNAKSQIGVIVGLRTNKLLYIGVRNKECSGCRRGF